MWHLSPHQQRYQGLQGTEDDMATPETTSFAHMHKETPASLGIKSKYERRTDFEVKTQEKLANLEERFAALEKRHNDLHEKVFTVTDNSTGKVTEVALTQLDAPHIASLKGRQPAKLYRVSSPTKAKTEEDAVSTMLSGTILGKINVKQATETETGPKSRARILINRTDPETGQRKDQLPSDTSPTVSKVTDTFHAFTLRKVLYEDEDDNDGELEITNENLWSLLKDLMGDYPYHIFRGPPVTLYSPYPPLIFNWDKLELATKEQSKEETDKQAREDLRILLDTLSSGSGDAKLDKYFKMRESNKDQKNVTYDTLWTLFPPGTLVYGKAFLGQDQVFIVKGNMRYWPHTSPMWSVHCWTYDWDGKMFKRLCLKLKIERFDGHKPIATLPFYPLEFQSNYTVIKKNLIERGKIFRNVCMMKQELRMFEYSGEAIFDRKGFSGIRGDDDNDEDQMSQSTFDPEIEFRRRLHLDSSSADSITAPKSTDVDSRVMVDFESYFRYGPVSARVGPLVSDNDNDECRCQDCQGNTGLRAKYRSKFDEKECQEGIWDEEQYMLCPPRVLGYVLRDKQWAQLQVTSLNPIPKHDPNNSWSTRLQLADGDETKKMILNLVNGHGTTESVEGENPLVVDDIVAKKGKGLVILLYDSKAINSGPPGVGKTSTAETVAIAARKPLFSISVADVGTKAKKVEANLAKIFALATSWQAILLIDEADVFLESRGQGMANNTERNALVSGILILTTNQIAQFDVAVQSRIHIAIKYGHLNKAQTLAIFNGFLNPLAEKNLIKGYDDVTEWLEEDVWKMGLDGRQIRNIVTSALGLARAEKRTKLEKKDLKQVLSNVKDFKDEFIRQFENYKTSQRGMVG
ncbi:P-loop containing nucleoside triphosphate hydrolase protein [Rutstroemia sp. NJR-2017a BVV2]|nr:P-loop containing nucleoside triphosphate hydrolase protein [Rutstroemia sp. NJR-2017a BVV2]